MTPIDSKTGNLIARHDFPTDLSDMKQSRDTTLIALASEKGDIYLIDSKSGQIIRQFKNASNYPSLEFFLTGKN